MRTTITHFFFVFIFAGLFLPAALAQEYGRVELETSCLPEAADALNGGTALLHHMMYEQAEARYREALGADPDCGMAYWGIAMSQLHPLWAPPTEAELEKGMQASHRARELGAPSEREEAYIEAIHTFFHTDGSFSERLASWEAAQRSLHEAHPGDVDAAAFYALARLATAPRDDTTFARQAEAGELLEPLLEQAPEHPGLFHYTIHAYDNPVLADRAVQVARAYDQLAPEVPHALHMPSHIFVRQGLWEDVDSWNRRSADAALKHPVDGAVSMHFAHAMDYLAYANLQRARDGAAQEDLRELLDHERYQQHLATAYALAAVPARIALERRAWEDAAALRAREPSSVDWDAFPAGESITWFAKGLGAARTGDAKAVAVALSRLDELHDALTEAGESYWAVLTDAQRKAVRAWNAYENGRPDEALALMREAADVEDSVDKHPITPSAPLPARELLGEMLLLADRPQEALGAFEKSLQVSRQRLNSLSGAGRAAELIGDQEKAERYYADAHELVAGNGEVDRPRMAQLRGFGDGQ